MKTDYAVPFMVIGISSLIGLIGSYLLFLIALGYGLKRTAIYYS